jgi:hypothetical protein
MSGNFKKIQGRSQPMHDAEALWEIYVACYPSPITKVSFEIRFKFCIINLHVHAAVCQCTSTDFSKELAAFFFSLVHHEERCNILLHNNGNYVPACVTPLKNTTSCVRLIVTFSTYKVGAGLHMQRRNSKLPYRICRFIYPTFVCMYVCTYVRVYVCVCMYVCMYVRMYVCMCVYVCMYVSMYVCMYLCVCVCVCCCTHLLIKCRLTAVWLCVPL